MKRWRFYFGACFLTGAILLPHADPGPVIAGMIVAGVLQFAWFKLMPPRNGNV